MTAVLRLLVSLALAGLADSSPPQGKTLVVTVMSQTTSGPRIGGAIVCLQGYPRKTTDVQGVAVFENVAAGSRSLAVWRDGFQNYTRSLLFNDYTSQQTNATALLQPGAGSMPACEISFDARPIADRLPDPPQITQFFLGGRENPALVANTENLILYAPHSGGRPTHFRVSTSSTFSGADWRPYAPEVPGFVGIGRFFAGATGSRTLYFQYRAGDQSNAPVSNVAQDTAELVAIGEHAVTDAAALIAHAESNGFSFRVTEAAAPPDCPPFSVATPFRGVLEAMYGGAEHGRGVIAYSAFSGRLLNAAWGLKQIELAISDADNSLARGTSEVQAVLHSAGNLRDARATLRFVAKPKPFASGGLIPSRSEMQCPRARAAISRITLIGPTGRDWREAFNR